jgi:uncharacterized protein
VLLAGLVLLACEVRAEVPAAPARWVTDAAGFLSAGARDELDGRLEAYQRQSGHQLLLWIGPTTGDVPLEDFTVSAFAAWKVGREGLDDGLVLFVFADDRKLRVEVGYGLEGEVPDAVASRILREAILPRVEAGDRDGAMRAGIAALIAAVEGRAGASESGVGAAPDDASPPARGWRSLGIGRIVLIGLGVIAFLILFATNPGLAVYLLFSVLSGGRGGGGGGGGYSGGGGRGGGGAHIDTSIDKLKSRNSFIVRFKGFPNKTIPAKAFRSMRPHEVCSCYFHNNIAYFAFSNESDMYQVYSAKIFHNEHKLDG